MGVALSLLIGAFAAPVGVRAYEGDDATTNASAAVDVPQGDLITPSARSVLMSGPLAKRWQAVNVASAAALSPAIVGAVVMSVDVAAGAGAGQLQLRPAGGSGVPMSIEYTAAGGTGLALVKVGRAAAIQARSTAGVREVALRLVAWIPKTSTFVVPARTAAAVNVDVSGTATQLRVSGIRGVPATAPVVVLALRSVAPSAGRLSVWTAGSRQPTAGDAFPAGKLTMVKLVRPSATGRIALRTPVGSASVQVTVLGWLPAHGSVAAAPTLLQLLRAGPDELVTTSITGVAGVPAAAKSVTMSVSAAAGGTVSIWPGTLAAGEAPISFTSTGGAVQTVVPVDTSRKMTVRVTGTNGATVFLVHGWTSQLGTQKLRFRPRVTTHLLAPADVYSEADGQLVLDPTAPVVRAGGHVAVQPPGGRAPYVVNVVSRTVQNGRQVLSTYDASLAAAFADYQAKYDGRVSGVPVTALPTTAPADSGTPSASTVADASTSALSNGIALSFFSGKHWDCGASVSPSDILSFDVEYSGNAHLDVSLSRRTLDFSIKGRLLATLTVDGQGTVYCTLQRPLPIQVPLGTTGLALRLGGTGTMSLTLPELGVGKITLKHVTSVYASIWYDNGDVVRGEAFDMSGNAAPSMDGGSLSLDLGVFVSVGPALPPGVDKWAFAGASLTVGLGFTAERASSADDPYHRNLRGPRCIDVSAAPYLEVGASVVAPFFPDASVTVARFDGPSKKLYQGPCYGYSGTITFNWVGTGEEQCGGFPTGCNTPSRNQQIVKTLIPGVASYNQVWTPLTGTSSYLHQPFTWTYSQSDTDDAVHNGCYFDWCPIPCLYHSTANGSGTRAWGDKWPDSDYEISPYLFEGFDYSTAAYAETGVLGATVTRYRDVTGDPASCGSDSEETGQVDGAGTAVISQTLDPLLENRKRIYLTLSGEAYGIPFTVVLDLTRAEYKR